MTKLLGHVTVVHEEACLRAWAFEELYGKRAERDYVLCRRGSESGPLDRADEGVRWVHGWLYAWWPPHRKRIAALRVASALAGPRPAPPPPSSIHAAQAAMAQATQLQQQMMHALTRDMQKLTADWARMGHSHATTVVRVKR